MNIDEIKEKQLGMTPVTWKTLESNGVTEETPLILDLFFYPETEEDLNSLVVALGSRYSEVLSGESQGKLVVQAVTAPLKYSLDSLLELVEEMCVLGVEHNSEFDGWGAQIPDSIQKKPWWRFW